MKHEHEHSFSTTWTSVNPHTTKIQQTGSRTITILSRESFKS